MLQIQGAPYTSPPPSVSEDGGSVVRGAIQEPLTPNCLVSAAPGEKSPGPRATIKFALLGKKKDFHLKARSESLMDNVQALSHVHPTRYPDCWHRSVYYVGLS